MPHGDQHDEPGPSLESQAGLSADEAATSAEPLRLEVKVVVHPGGGPGASPPEPRRPTPTQELHRVEEELVLDLEKDTPPRRRTTGRHVHVRGTEPGFPDVNPSAFTPEPDPDFDEAEDLPPMGWSPPPQQQIEELTSQAPSRERAPTGGHAETPAVPSLQPLSTRRTRRSSPFGTARQEPNVRFPAWITVCVLVAAALALAALIWFGEG